MNPLFQALSQTWPVRAVKDAIGFATAPKRAYTGELQMWDPETGHVSDAAVEAGTGMAGLAMTGGLGGLGGMSRQGVVGSGPIRAYHGSPHDFDRFDLSKIGTGEGAQAYGHGLYFAENEGVARAYRESLSQGTTPIVEIGGKKVDGNYLASMARNIADEAKIYGFETAKKNALDDLAFRLPKEQKLGAYGRVDQVQEAIDAIKGMTPKDLNVSRGRMYEVAIHADPERFLDWDAPLLDKVASTTDPVWGLHKQYTARDPMVTGQKLHDTMQSDLGPRGVTERLREAGIPGIKYLDQGSRTAGDGSRNYVTFSDNIVEILRKYGLVGGLGGLGGMQAMQEPRT